MSRGKLTAILSAAVTGLIVSALWAAQPSTRGVEKTGGQAGQPGPLRQLLAGRLSRLKALGSELDLTTDQKGQIRSAVVAHKGEIAAVASDVVAKRRSLHEAVRAANPDEAAIRAAATALGKSIGDAAVLASKVIGEIKPILTPEQIERIQAFREENAAATDTFLGHMMAEQ